MKLRIIILLLLLVVSSKGYCQYVYGTTGLLHAPTADMQKDKTLMVGASYLDIAATPGHWGYNTYNYYLNITFFPWLEVGYTCTLHKLAIPEHGYSYKFRNQDRQFSLRVRVWKEGWWKKWTPQIVIGANDPGTSDVAGNPNKDDYGISDVAALGNGYWNRYYIAATKHLNIANAGNLGVHAAYVYNQRNDYHLNGPTIGANFRFELPGSGIGTKILNSLNLMAEYDSRSANIGVACSFWKERLNAVVELTECKHFSAGVMMKVRLK